MAHKIKFIIDEDGTITADQIGWEGDLCDGKINDIIKELGEEKKTTKKLEYYRENKLNIENKW